MKNFLKRAFDAIFPSPLGPLRKSDLEFLDQLKKICPDSKTLQADGTRRTKHGRDIFPYSISVRTFEPRGWRMDADMRFFTQPRMGELAKQIAPLRSSPMGDKIHLNEETGDFYLHSDVLKNGIANATILGQIDVAVERDLLDMQETRIRTVKAAFGHQPR